MRKVFILVFVFISSLMSAQIGTVTVAQKSDDSVMKKDTTFPVSSNYLYKDLHLYKGQELYFLPISKDKKVDILHNGYKGFKTTKFDYTKDTQDKKRYGTPAPANKENTSFVDVEGKVFIVTDVKVFYEELYGRKKEKAYLYLTNKEDENDKCIYLLPTGNWNVPFVVMKHYDWLKERLVGKTYYIASPYIFHTNILTGNDLKADESYPWKCIDVITSPITGLLSMLLEGKDGARTYTTGYSHFGNSSYSDEFSFLRHVAQMGSALESTTDAINFYIAMDSVHWNQYGDEIALAILEHRPVTGMTFDQVRAALGCTPKQINTHADGIDQYVFKMYSRTYYVYISNGIVVSWSKY